MNRARALLILLLCAGLGLLLVWSLLELPPPAVRLPTQVQDYIDIAGAAHPVTAVLLNFRGYDTMLEVAVLLLAVLGVLAGTSVEKRRAAAGRRPGLPMLRAFARLMVPLMILVAGYLLWAGAYRPGGAFQAGAVLAATGVLLHLARLLPAWATPSLVQRWGLAAGFLVFLAIGALPAIPWLFPDATLLQYPLAWASVLILVIETALTISIGLLLAGLFLSLSDDGMEFER